jgi:hypothetical protein
MLNTLTTRTSRTFYTEAEAAQALGISSEQFRALVRAHIFQDAEQSEDDLNNIGAATYQSSDLVILKHLVKMAAAR